MVTVEHNEIRQKVESDESLSGGRMGPDRQARARKKGR